tara:strand:+ start:275 stop:541 length:267 start_codon:yes stop_codon:yes gene_type:complete
VAKQLGKTPEEIEDYNDACLFPDIASHLWSTFIQLHKGRTYGMNGPNPISEQGLYYWSKRSGITLAYWEIEIMQSLDNLWMEITSKES